MVKINFLFNYDNKSMNLELLVISTHLQCTICKNPWCLEVTLPLLAHSSRYRDVKNNK